MKVKTNIKGGTPCADRPEVTNMHECRKCCGVAFSKKDPNFKKCTSHCQQDF